MTRLALRDEDATSVEIAGDFTNWKFVAATRATNGVWFVDLRIPPGQYRYAFRVDRTKWKVPSGAVVSDDDFGGKSAWLTVRGPSKYAAP
jgi:1,4-alpha-glucan branching enzyme